MLHQVRPIMILFECIMDLLIVDPFEKDEPCMMRLLLLLRILFARDEGEALIWIGDAACGMVCLRRSLALGNACFDMLLKKSIRL